VIWNGAVIWIIEEVEHGTGDDERRWWWMFEGWLGRCWLSICCSLGGWNGMRRKGRSDDERIHSQSCIRVKLLQIARLERKHTLGALFKNKFFCGDRWALYWQ
jgi:hypothetical protein